MRWTRNDSAMTTHTSTSNTQSNGHPPPAGPLHRWVLPIRPLKPVNPALVKHAEQRAEYEQNRIADAITTFAGSMTFVYIHILWFGCWIGFGVEKYPFGLLTMIVSLEAIFLSTFVMISQNRADAKRQVIADQQWRTVQEEDEQNKQLLGLSRQILAPDQRGPWLRGPRTAGPRAERAVAGLVAAHSGPDRAGPRCRRSRWGGEPRLRADRPGLEGRRCMRRLRATAAGAD